MMMLSAPIRQAVFQYLLPMLLLLLPGEGHADRNPFAPVTSSCQPSQPRPFNWRLIGIIGQQEQYHAWLMAPKGKWVHRRKGEALDERWKLQQVDALGLTLEALQGCQPPLKVVLKGSIYEKDLLPAATSAAGPLAR